MEIKLKWERGELARSKHLVIIATLSFNCMDFNTKRVTFRFS